MAIHSRHFLIMEISIKTFVMFGSVILTGLSAGLFYAWSVSVIPGTQKITDTSYLETMQSINRAILNPAFFLVFFGSMVFLTAASIYQFNVNKFAFWLMLSASITYLIGTLGVTGLGNVPLNNQLEELKLGLLSNTKLSEFRRFYETNWNRLHWIRTACAIISFFLAVASAFAQIKDFT